MKRVLQVLGSLQRGGAETLVMNIYRNIDRKEIQFDFIVRENVDNGYEDEVIKMGGRIFVIPSPKKIGLIKSIKMHIEIMKNNGPYIAVHSHINAMSFISMYSAKKCKIANRISHSHSTVFPGKLKLAFGRYFIKMFSTKLLACSEEAGIKLFRTKKFEVIHNGIILDDFIVNDEKENVFYKEKLKFPLKSINIIHVGRFVEPKNHEFIIEIAKKLRDNSIDFKMFLLGDGDKFNFVKNAVIKNELSNYIHLLGSISNVNEYMKAADIMIMPSLYEGFPVTLVEAQTAGLPAIVSDRITKKVDLNLNLIEFKTLNIDEWIEYISLNNYTRLYNKDYIYNSITNSNFNILNTAKIILEMYNR